MHDVEWNLRVIFPGLVGSTDEFLMIHSPAARADGK